MRVLMLGWEFPPMITGGLGTACYGLTRALGRENTPITFVLPRAQRAQSVTPSRNANAPEPPAGRITLHAPSVGSPARRDPAEPAVEIESATAPANHAPVTQVGDPDADAPTDGDASTFAGADTLGPDFASVAFHDVPARFVSPYPGGQAVASPQLDPADPDYVPHTKPGGFLTSTGYHDPEADLAPPDPSAADNHEHAPPPPAPRSTQADYSGDLIQEARRYAALVVELARSASFDVIHAHDWLTYPAAIAVAAVTGKPLVVHVHSTEYDRAGETGQPEIHEIERRGVHAAQRVIAVSRRTARQVQDRYGVHPDRVEVVYNGIDPETPQTDADPPAPASAPNVNSNGHAEAAHHSAPATPSAPHDNPAGNVPAGDRIVLFLGRLTMQKGPAYFVEAARRVHEKRGDVTFVMAGAGDLADQVADLAHHAGLDDKIRFPGFLNTKQVHTLLNRADVLVMPSVSEPFGIAPLEAIRHDVPVIISKTAGVAEVLEHALKVDFWDVDEIANKIVAVLRCPALRDTLAHHAESEARKLTWDQAAASCLRIYQSAADASIPIMTAADATPSHDAPVSSTRA